MDDDHEIIKPINELSYDDFRSTILSDKNESSFGEIRKTGIRAYTHFIGKFDPTGIIDFVIKESDRIESIAKDERIIKGMYLLFRGIIDLYNKHENLKKILQSEQIPLLINRYNEKVIRTINPEKIQYFRNLICNGFINSNLSLDEKELFLNILDELTIDQINILAILYEFKKSPDVITHKLYGEMKRDGSEHLIVKEISKLINKNINNTFLFITNLIGKGLVLKVSRYLDIDDLKDDSQVGLNDFCTGFIDEIKEIN